MAKERKVKEVIKARPTVEGAGVHLKRAFGFNEAPRLDPFLMLDDFHGMDPEKYLPGFPWHPHRGIETITYLLEGRVEHGDSLNNSGTITPGDVQWMTAGSGIVHQEMPKGNPSGRLWGFQLWANLPARQKMMAPRYRDVDAASIPTVTLGQGAAAKVICGTVNGVSGPVTDIVIDPMYLDVFLMPGGNMNLPVPAGHTLFAYMLTGLATLGGDGFDFYGEETLVVFDDGDELYAHAGNNGARFLLVAGKPLGEPVAWRGPIVMNTQEELDLAFQEYREGNFIKHS